MSWKWLDQLMDRIFSVAGALVLAQAPEYFQQYTQRLAGHVNELQRYINAMQKIADLSGKSLEDYIGKFVTHQDFDIASQGQLMAEMLHRWSMLNESLQSMTSASLFYRPFAFFRYVQTDIAWMTLKDFSPAFPITLESALYALFGLVLGYALYQSLKRPFVRKKKAPVLPEKMEKRL
jgi:hypothetical protein